MYESEEMNKTIDIDGIMEIFVLGYSLNGKTMLKHKKFLMAQMPPFRIYSKPSTIDDVYEALEQSVEQSLDSNMALALTGGLDSRIIAGLVAQFDKDVFAFTCGSSYTEQEIARKICSVLNLRHYAIKLPPLNFELLTHIKKILTRIGGHSNLLNVYMRTCMDEQLSRIGIKQVLTGGGFDEVNGGTSAMEVYSKDSFINSRIRHSHPVLPQKYREVVFRNLTQYCKGIPFRKLFPLVIVRNRFLRKFEIKEWVNRTTPLINSEVLSSICSLPYHERLNKRMQREILRRYFPKLYNIPYAMSLLLPRFPHIIHRGVNNMARKFYIQTKLRHQCPLVTNSQYHFFRSNIHLFYLSLQKYPPPLFKSKDVKYLINNLDSKSARLLNIIAIYSVICEEMEGKMKPYPRGYPSNGIAIKGTGNDF